MDPSTLVVTAVVAGAALALKDVTSSVVKDAYAGLTRLIIDKYGDKGAVADALDKVEANPESKGRQTVLEEDLTTAGADHDEELLKAAQALLAQADPEGTRQGAYTITQIAGDDSIQIGQARDVKIEREK